MSAVRLECYKQLMSPNHKYPQQIHAFKLKTRESRTKIVKVVKSKTVYTKRLVSEVIKMCLKGKANPVTHRGGP
jgi:hypothetical protein